MSSTHTGGRTFPGPDPGRKASFDRSFRRAQGERAEGRETSGITQSK